MIELGENERLLYRELLKTPGASLTEVADRVDLPLVSLETAWQVLLDRGLAAEEEQSGLHAVPPQLGYSAMIGRTERSARELLQAADLARAQVTEMAIEYAEFRSHEAVVELTSLQAVRARLSDLSSEARATCDSMTPQRTVSSDAMDASRPLNDQALERGVVMRCLYPDSLRNDPGTLAYARWLTEHGSGLRTTPVVPLQLLTVDHEVALIPIDPRIPELGALEVRSPGMVMALDALFERAWAVATELDTSAAPNTSGLTPQEAELVRMLATGHTDESAARRLQISVRSVRRLVADLTDRLDAKSRFEAGVKAATRGWV